MFRYITIFLFFKLIVEVIMQHISQLPTPPVPPAYVADIQQISYGRDFIQFSFASTGCACEFMDELENSDTTGVKYTREGDDVQLTFNKDISHKEAAERISNAYGIKLLSI